MYFRWSRSIYRSTIGRYIGRLSTDISVVCRSTIGRLSVDYRSTIGRLSVDYRSTIGRLSVDYRSTIGRLSVDYRSTIGRLSVNIRPIFDRYIGRLSTDRYVDRYSLSTSILDRYMTDTWPILGRYLTDT